MNLAAGETKGVLCVTQWIPSYVNDGHKCLIVEVYSPADPLLYRDEYFHVAEDRHVAQRNISVLAPPAPFPDTVFIFSAAPPKNEKEEMYLIAKREPIKRIEKIAMTLGFRELPKEAEELDKFGLIPYKCGQPVTDFGKREISLKLPPKKRVSMVSIVKDTNVIKENQAAPEVTEFYNYYVLKTYDEVIGRRPLDLPPLNFSTVGMWFTVPMEIKEEINDLGLDFEGGLHAVEHAMIAMSPFYALCDSAREISRKEKNELRFKGIIFRE